MPKVKFSHMIAASALLDKDIVWWPVPVTVDGQKYLVAQLPTANTETEIVGKVRDMAAGYGFDQIEIVPGNEILAAFPAAPIVNDVKRPPLDLSKRVDGAVDTYVTQVLEDLYQAGVSWFEMRCSGSGDSSNDSDYDWRMSVRDWTHNNTARARQFLPGMPDAWLKELHNWAWEGQFDMADQNEGGGGLFTFDLTDPANPTASYSTYYNEVQEVPSQSGAF